MPMHKKPAIFVGAGCGQAMTAATKVTCWSNCYVRQTMLCEVATPRCGMVTAAVSSGFDSTCRETSICCANASTVLHESQGWQNTPHVDARVAVLLCMPAQTLWSMQQWQADEMLQQVKHHMYCAEAQKVRCQSKVLLQEQKARDSSQGFCGKAR